jgi:hypothetical protein
LFQELVPNARDTHHSTIPCFFRWIPHKWWHFVTNEGLQG